MKTFLKVLAALLSLTGAALLIKLSAEVMGECTHSYIEVDDR